MCGKSAIHFFANGLMLGHAVGTVVGVALGADVGGAGLGDTASSAPPSPITPNVPPSGAPLSGTAPSGALDSPSGRRSPPTSPIL
jgi:hypothetical protein